MQDKLSNNAIILLTRLKSALNISKDGDLATFLGVKQNTLSTWKTRNSVDYAVIISKSDKIDLNWLIRGNESPLDHPLKKSVSPIVSPIVSALENPFKNSKRKKYLIEGNKENFMAREGVPYFEELKATAGDIPSFLQDAKPTSYINLPQIRDCQAILPVYGNSMKGLIESGDLIAIKEIISRQEFDPAVPYLIITEEHRMIKFLRADSNDEQTIWATSTNHEPIKLFVDNIKKVYAIRCVIRFF